MTWRTNKDTEVQPHSGMSHDDSEGSTRSGTAGGGSQRGGKPQELDTAVTVSCCQSEPRLSPWEELWEGTSGAGGDSLLLVLPVCC